MRTYTILSAFKSSVSMGLLTLLLLIGTFTSYSQTTPANCTQGCTSSDVQIIRAYLSNQAGVQLDETFVCPESGSALVYLTLELATNTPRQGVSIFANVKTFTPPSTVGSTIYTASECFGILLNQPTNKVTFQVPFNWPCTSSVVLTDIFIAWGTGNKNFCTGTAFQCPATPSKCYQLPPGEFISVGTPSGNNAELKECESSVGSGSAIFDLTDAESTVIGSQTNVTVRWYSDAAGTTEITGSNITSYNSSSTIVYAKVCSNVSPYPCSGLKNVTLTVVSRPTALALTGSSICSSAPNTGSITSSTSGAATISYQLYNGSNQTVQSAKTGTGSGLTWSNLPAGNGYYVIATGPTPTSCTSTSSSVNVSSIDNPVVLALTGSSICSSAPNTGTVTSSTSGAATISYQLFNGSNQAVQSAQAGTGSGLTWSNLPAGNGYYVVATGPAPTSCTSTSNAVNVSSVNNPVALILTGSSICSSAPNTGTVTSSTSGAATISYQLFNGSNQAVQSAQAGTGSGLTWSNLPAGNGYYVMATGATPTNCTSTSNPVNVSSITNPAALVLTGSAICSSAPNTGTVTSSTSGAATISYQLYNGSNQPVQSAKAGTGSGLSWSSLPAGNGYYVVATGASPTNCTSSSNVVNVGSIDNPLAPSVDYTPPACDANSFSITVNGLQENDIVTVKDKNGAAIGTLSPASPYNVPASTASKIFSGIPAGSGYEVVISRNGCISTTASCTSSASRVFQQQPQEPDGTIEQVTIVPKEEPVVNSQAVSTNEPMVKGIKVTAYPNPYSDKVRFVVNTEQAGEANLELVNILGQKIATIYNGHLMAGSRSFEVTLPMQHRSTVVYILRLNGKQVTGKLLQSGY